jgi:tetratricopeptide (TPR) repeat protein
LRGALEYYNRAFETKEKVGDIRGLASTINNLGLVQRLTGDIPGAIKTQEKGLKMRQRIGDLRGTSNTYSAIGLTWFDSFDFEKAIHYMHKALEIEERISDLQGIGTSCTNLGDIYFNLGQPDEARRYLERGLEMGERLKDGVMVCHNLITMSELQASEGLITESEITLERARTRMENLGSRGLLGELSRAAGVIAGRRGDWESASRNYRDAVGIFREMADPAPIVKTLLYQARTATFLGLANETDAAMNDALDTARTQVKGTLAENIERLWPGK